MSDNNDEEQSEAKYKKKGKCVKDEDNFRNVVPRKDTSNNRVIK